MLRLDSPETADQFVTEQRAVGNDVRWETFAKTLIFFRPDERGIYSKHGAQRNGVWGFENRVEINDKGILEVDSRNARGIKNSSRY